MIDFLIVLGVISLLLWAVILHELGHYLTFRAAGFKQVDVVFKYHNSPNFKGHLVTVGDNIDYTSLSRFLIVGIYLNGILLGLIPIILFASIGWPIYLITICCYFLGCFSDIKNIVWVLKNEDFNKIRKGRKCNN